MTREELKIIYDKHFEKIYFFCHGLLGDKKEAAACTNHAFIQIVFLFESHPKAIESEFDVMSFLYITARAKCLKRLEYLKYKKSRSWRSDLKKMLENIFKLIMNMKRFVNWQKT